MLILRQHLPNWIRNSKGWACQWACLGNTPSGYSYGFRFVCPFVYCGEGKIYKYMIKLFLHKWDNKWGRVACAQRRWRVWQYHAKTKPSYSIRWLQRQGTCLPKQETWEVGSLPLAPWKKSLGKLSFIYLFTYLVTWFILEDKRSLTMHSLSAYIYTLSGGLFFN